MPDDLNMNQKLENILNVSLDATEDELRKTNFDANVRKRKKS